MIRVRSAALLVLSLCLISGCSEERDGEAGTQSPPASTPAKPVVDSVQGEEYEIFFASAGGRLGTERRRLEATDLTRQELVSALVREVIRGPSDSSSLGATLPDGTTVRAVFMIADDIAVVDLGGEALRDWTTGSSAEMAAVYSVVNTITGNIPEIQSVQILVEGREVQTLAGHVDLSRPLRPKNL